MAWDSGVAVPPTSAYGPPQVDFSILGNLYNTYQQSQRNRQEQQQNDLILQKQRNDLEQQQKLQGIFANGIPKDAQGNLDFRAITEQLAKAGDINAIQQLYPAIQQQQAGQVSPLLGGGGGGAAAGNPAPAAAPVGDLPPTAGRGPTATASAPDASASGGSSVTGIVAGQLGDGDPRTGPTMLRIAQTLGVDPNQRLTLGQQRRAQGLLDQYAGSPAPGKTQVASAAPVAPAAAPLTPAQQIQARFAGDRSAAPAPQPAPPAAPPVAAQPAPAPTPIVPKVPLPPGFTDPQKAILALRAEAAHLSNNPYNAGQVKELNDYAKRIEDSLQNVTVTSGQTILSPDGKVIYKGAQTQMSGDALDAAAERYRQTGTLPPRLGSGAQGLAEVNAIQNRAAEQELAAGGNPADWSGRWQDYKAEQAGKSQEARTGASREANLKIILRVTDAAIPAALEASEKVARTGWVPINRVIQHGEVIASDPDLRSFGMANLQLAEGWARAMNPTGVMRESDRDKALEFLNTADSKETYKRLVNQLKTQIDRELKAVQGMKGAGAAQSQGPVPGGAAPSEGAQDGGWTTLPGGVRIREVK